MSHLLNPWTVRIRKFVGFGIILLITLFLIRKHSSTTKHEGKDAEEWFQIFAADWSSYGLNHQVPLTSNQTAAIAAFRAIGDDGIDYLIQIGYQAYNPTLAHKAFEDFIESFPWNKPGMFERKAYEKKNSALALLDQVGMDFHQAKKKTQEHLTSKNSDQIVTGLLLLSHSTNNLDLLVEQYRPFILHPKSIIRYVTQQGLRKCGLHATNAIPELLQLSSPRITKQGYEVLTNIGKNSTEISNQIVTLTENTKPLSSFIAQLALCSLDQKQTKQSSQRLIKLIREELIAAPSRGSAWTGMLLRLRNWSHPFPTLHPLLLDLPNEYFQTTVQIADLLDQRSVDISPLIPLLRKVLKTDSSLIDFHAANEIAILLLLKSDPQEPAVWDFLDQQLKNNINTEQLAPYIALIQTMAPFNEEARALFDTYPISHKELSKYRVRDARAQLRAHQLLLK